MDSIASLASKCTPASVNDVVLNSECAYTFHTPFTSEKGIVVNLQTYIGTVEEMAFRGCSTGNEALFVRIVKNRVPKPEEEGEGDNKQPTKLGIGVEGGFSGEDDKFETVTQYSLVVLKKEGEHTVIVMEQPYVVDELPEEVVKLVDSVILHAGMSTQQDVKVWQLDTDTVIPVSKYAESLPFVDNGVLIDPDPKTWKCAKSGDTENIWLNLSDGYIGGGRKNWDGSGGSNGALDHFQETGEIYPLVVKLGTITADLDSADCYSYAKDEDGPVKIPNLADLLAKRGIKVNTLQKTVKSTAELEVELNANYAFDAITSAGKTLKPVSGPSLQGLQNLGNSCYMNSVLQILFSLPELGSRYGVKPNASVAENPLLNVEPKEAPTDLLCQTAKVASALTSGIFAKPKEEIEESQESKTDAANPKYRVAPRLFKHVVGGDHVDFRTGQQQDAAQFLQYMLEKLDRAELGAVAKNHPHLMQHDPFHVSSHLFSFKTTTRLVCSADESIKYSESPAPETVWSLPIPMEKAVVKDDEPEQKRHKPDEPASTEQQKPVPTISFEQVLEAWAAETTVEDIRWPHLQNTVHSANQTTRLSNFPRYLIVQVQRYTLGPDWSPVKLEVKLEIGDKIDLNSFRSSGPREGETLVPPEEEKPAASVLQAPTIDEGALCQLMDMGFSMNGCKRALTAVGGSDVEAAMNWVFEHNMDPDFNDPMEETSSAPVAGSSDSGVDEAVVMSLVDSLGCFTADQIRAALKETNGAADRAADWLFSHMDDLEGAIAALNNKNAESSAKAPSIDLEDGNGEYMLTGMISHIGKHTGSGHYVAHVKHGDDWIIFNDEKVAICESPPSEHAYMYLLQRSDTVGSSSPHY